MMRLVMLLVILFVVGIVMFGKNPIKELQKEQLKYGKDPLERATNLYIEKQGGVPDAPKDTSVAKPDENLYEGGSEVLVPSNTAGTQATTTQAKPAPLQTDSYYPPIVGGNNVDAQQPAPASRGAYSDVVRLRSGQEISFDRARVFAVGSDGKKTPLPDGKYTLEDGRSVVVSGGKQIFQSDN